MDTEAYAMSIDVAVSELRAHLNDYLDRARAGAEVVITDRGMPIARLLGVTATTTLERLTADGIIARSAAPRPRASGQPAPAPPTHRRHSQRPAALTMALIYFDSSALVKLLVQEEGSDLAADCGTAAMLPWPADSPTPRSAPRWLQPTATTTSARMTWTWPSRHGSDTGPRYVPSNSPQPSNARPDS